MESVRWSFRLQNVDNIIKKQLFYCFINIKTPWLSKVKQVLIGKMQGEVKRQNEENLLTNDHNDISILRYRVSKIVCVFLEVGGLYFFCWFQNQRKFYNKKLVGTSLIL